MEKTLREMMLNVEVTKSMQAGPLQVFGLRCTGHDSLNYFTLDEALEANSLDITEVSEGGSVPDLKVTNKADRFVLLLSGEQLIGAKQNRTVNASMMVPAHSELVAPVSCVERGRWGYKSRKFGSGSARSPSSRVGG